ncbi:hypothetical protein [Actinosynnema pretiosum]|uniref:Uncharacterized protein n=1 Tax=Actinosynnema pretiosum TaxID=42197 RepID=A0A290ZFP1_9PSEU|nr:hypothetical protein [Actinosynnema pretiosum]ATE57805.1 hypothetical protein CNX65_34560 [Actinosynnema pretiosum]
MYIDESAGAADSDLKVAVDDEEYTVEVGYDLDHDGVDETAVVETDDGGRIAFSDTDGDGDADLMTTFDDRGEVVQRSRFDDASGEWVRVGEDSERTNSAEGRDITVTTANGSQDVGPATVDSDEDGRADSVMIEDAEGDTWLFTDSDGDGQADVATEITRDGEVTVSQRTGDAEWTEVEHGRFDSTGKYTADSGSDQLWGDGVDDRTAVSGVVRIDSTTGQWISPN